MKDFSFENCSYADHVSDHIIDFVNRECLRLKKEFSTTQMLAGIMLGLLGYMKTAEGLEVPPEFEQVQKACSRCLRSMANEEKETKT